MDQRILDALRDIAAYAPTIDSWKRLMQVMQITLNPELRHLVSYRRGRGAKPSQLDLDILCEWERLTGTTLVFNDDGTQHTPS